MTALRELGPDALPDIVKLMARCLEADGGLPDAAGEGFLRRRFGERAAGVVEGGHLVAAVGVRANGTGHSALGLVDPGARGRGLGSALLDWSLDTAEVIETESLTRAAEELFTSRGLEQTFGEVVMRHDLDGLPPRGDGPQWTIDPWDVERAYAVYTQAFADRPGFPGWSLDEWRDWLIDDDFRPEWSAVAREGDQDLGFVACADGWLVQLGTVPQARGKGVGRELTCEALRRMRAEEAGQVLLDVNVNNPGAAALYRKLGFAEVGRRARFGRA